MFKAIEVVGGRRTGREFQFDAATRQAAVAALLAELQVSESAAVVDATRTLVLVGDARWSIVAIQNPTVVSESSSLRRGGAKHKQVR
ncbi:MAG: hypothetical protein JO057_13190 [Chloroflexi bacterium]|nr:hypothetical protein [Chloroflexota bacterium]